MDWALRWYSLGIDYEMHGEDLLESARLSSKIVKVLGGEPPELFKYELFLDEKGKKISKKIGNGISLEQWLRFAPVDSLLYIMYVKPQIAKKMGLPLLPEIVDQYLDLVAQYDGAEDSPVPFISRLSKGAHAGKLEGQETVTYSLICELILALNEDDPRVVRDYLLKYQPGIGGNVGLLRAAHRGCPCLLQGGAPPRARRRAARPLARRHHLRAPRRACRRRAAGTRSTPTLCRLGVPDLQGAGHQEQGLVSHVVPHPHRQVAGPAHRQLHRAARVRRVHRALGGAPLQEVIAYEREPWQSEDHGPGAGDSFRDRKKGKLSRLLPFLGPAFIASVAYMDPGNFATNIQGGAQYGYMLLWVIFASNLIAMLLQTLSAKLGIASGKNLAEHCREQFRPSVVFGMWLLAEIVAMATDLAEFLGAALGFSLLFGIPLWIGGILTAIATFLILSLERFGFRPLEAVITALVGVIAVELPRRDDSREAAHGPDPLPLRRTPVLGGRKASSSRRGSSAQR